MIRYLVLTLALQESETIPKAHKEIYKKAAEECKEAAGLIDTDPRRALELLDAVLGDEKVAKRECRLRIEMQSGYYTGWYEFFPYQYRGRALLRLAESETDRDKARLQLGRAASDLRESVRRGLASSEPFLKTAEDRLAKLKVDPPRIDPEPAFRRAWQAHLDADKFAAAKEHLKAKGAFLAESKRKQYEADTERACREHLDIATEQFLRGLERIQTLQEIREMRSDKFPLPDRADMVATTAAYDWCLAMRDTLARLRDGKEVLTDLLDRSTAAIRLPEKRWFLAAERLAYEFAREAIEARVVQARDAAAPERKRLREEAESLRARWPAFESRPRDFAPLLAGFPVEDDLASPLLADLRASMEADDPARAMAEIQKKILDLRAEDRWKRLAIESRRAVVKLQILGGALGAFLVGRTIDDVAREFRALGRELKELGGTLEERGFGSKVRQLFERLR